MAESNRFNFAFFFGSLRESRFLWAFGGLLLLLISYLAVALQLGRPALVWSLLTATSGESLNQLVKALAPLEGWWRAAQGFFHYLPLLIWASAVVGFSLGVIQGTAWLSRKGASWLTSFGWLAFVPAAGAAAFEGVRLGLLLDHILVGAETLSPHAAAAVVGATYGRWILFGLLLFGAIRWIRRGRFDGREGSEEVAPAASWVEVQSAEHEALRQSRESLARSGGAQDWVGLAFSGGGIRSATFNLGLVQALARGKLLRAVDYLSTVSGGGYLGGWLAKWAREADGIEPVEAALGKSDEPRQVRFLRRYSNYLTPRAGLFTADTWATVATYIRNSSLNLLILLSGIAALLLLPRLLVGFMEPGAASAWLAPVHANISFLVAAALTLSGTIYLTAQIPEPKVGGGKIPEEGIEGVDGTPAEDDLEEASEARPARQEGLLFRAVLPFGIASVFATHWLFAGKAYFCSKFLGFLYAQTRLGCSGDETSGCWVCWVFLAALGYGAATLLASRSAPEGTLGENARGRFPWLGTVSALAAGAVAGLAFYGFGQALGFNTPVAGREADLWPVLVYGPPGVMGIFTLAGVLHIGLAGRFWTDHQREWLARVGGWLLIFAVVWMAALAIAVYGVPVLLAAGPLVKAALASGWILTTLGGLAAGRGLQKGGEASRFRGVLLNVGPYVFIAGLLALLSLGLDAGLSKITAFTSPERGADIAELWDALKEPADTSSELPGKKVSGASREAGTEQAEETLPGFLALLKARSHDHHLLLLRQSQGIEVLVLFGLLLSLAFIAAHQVDINEFSMHSYYRNRLVRCYLGASNAGRHGKETTADPFTGFDENDDLELAKAWMEKGGQGGGRPFPILNTALNLVQGGELAWQTRKAASLVLTPLFCGYEFPVANRGRDGARGGFRSSRGYGSRLPSWSKNSTLPEGDGITLGTAMAISGAAASPNMGYRTTPTLALLMTIFNVRLGWWVGNPAHAAAWRYASPRFGLGYLTQELFGLTSAKSPFVYTSDGGHFENLGIYELVRRRCMYIIACDAEQDKDLLFSGLGNAVRRCRTDFGATLEITVDPIRQGEAHWVKGKVRYEDGTEGELLYIKASLTGERDEPEDVLEYEARNPDFPHQSTADQFFDEDQFESYRALGQHIGDELLRVAQATSPPKSWGEVFKRLV